MNLYWSGPLEGHIRNFSSGVCVCVGGGGGGVGGGGAGLPCLGKYQVYHNIANLKPLFNFMLVLTIKGDILGAFGALHV